MAQTVDEIMNRELFAVHPNDSAQQALDYILALGISGAPVLDPYGVPVGMVTLRDLVDSRGDRVAERMTTPAVVLASGTSIEEAARHLGDLGLHRAVIIDKSHHARGMVSSLDLMRALVGLPAKHPRTFEHIDPETGLSWRDDEPLDAAHVVDAPADAGVLALVRGRQGQPERVVWAEAASNLMARLEQLLASPESAADHLREALDAGELRFRLAIAPDVAARMRALRKVLLEARDKARDAGAGP